MKVIILAGGWGSRLGQLSESVPKPMINVGEKPIIWHVMNRYAKYGFTEFVIALGVKGNIIKNYFYNYHVLNNDLTVNLQSNKTEFHTYNNKDWKVTLVDTGVETLKGGRIKRIEKYLDSDTNMLTYGDGLADIDINALIECHKKMKKTITITGVHPPARFGELIEKDGIVQKFEEKPQTSVGLINGGYMIFNKNLLEYLSDDEDCDFEIGPLEKLASIGDIATYKHNGNWECMDSERDVNHLNSLWKAKKAFWI